MASVKIDTERVLQGVTLRNRLIRELVERIEALEGELAAAGERPSGKPDPHGEPQAPSSPGVEPLATRINRLQATIDRLESQLSAAGEGAVEDVGDPDYARVLRNIRETVRQHVPGDATVAVASGGDPELMLLYGRRAVHFPETADHRYADDPLTAPEAIQSLEAARKTGASFLLVPRPSFTWVSERGEFAEYLSQRYPAVTDDENCILYSLGSVPDSRNHWPRRDSSTDDGVVSVILPVHNAIRPGIGDQWLHESIHSVLNQEGIQLELLIVDDGSVDGTEHVLAEYDDRAIVNVITLQKWRGYGAAMNIGADAAIGSFLARISVGDRFLPGKLAAQQTAMVDRQLDLVGADVRVIDEAGAQVGETRRFPDSDDGIRGDILNGLALHPSSTMMRKRVWAEVGGYVTDPAFRFAEDLEFFARVVAHPVAFRFGKVGAVLCEDRSHEGRVTRSPLTRDLSRSAGQHVRSEAGAAPAAAERG